jgi:hypothetical protein
VRHLNSFSLPYGCQSYDRQSLTAFFILIND